jgi:hypothetical protein
MYRIYNYVYTYVYMYDMGTKEIHILPSFLFVPQNTFLNGA